MTRSTAQATSKRRQLGEESRRRILDAVAEIAGERGYEGTSMAAISEASGLPVASIYWHFTNKDQLLEAVIDRSFDTWRATTEWTPSPGGSTTDSLSAMLARNAEAFASNLDFLRLGLMLTLERRPEEPAARTRFIEVRRLTLQEMAAGYRAYFGPTLSDADAERLARFTLACGDGLFIALQAEPVTELVHIFDDMAVAIAAVAERMLATS
jgi:AcrR family transcriptional regulator